jgi:hypothetical protein
MKTDKDISNYDEVFFALGNQPDSVISIRETGTPTKELNDMLTKEVGGAIILHSPNLRLSVRAHPRPGVVVSRDNNHYIDSIGSDGQSMFLTESEKMKAKIRETAGEMYLASLEPRHPPASPCRYCSEAIEGAGAVVNEALTRQVKRVRGMFGNPNLKHREALIAAGISLILSRGGPTTSFLEVLKPPLCEVDEKEKKPRNRKLAFIEQQQKVKKEMPKHLTKLFARTK